LHLNFQYELWPCRQGCTTFVWLRIEIQREAKKPRSGKGNTDAEQYNTQCEKVSSFLQWVNDIISLVVILPPKLTWNWNMDHKEWWCEIWGFHGNEDSSQGLLCCDAMQCCRIQVFWRTVLPTSSGWSEWHCEKVRTYNPRTQEGARVWQPVGRRKRTVILVVGGGQVAASNWPLQALKCWQCLQGVHSLLIRNSLHCGCDWRSEVVYQMCCYR